ncbi:MAG: NAD(P)H-hydrate dehydratase [Candidatus Izimaplasma sp.]|nr:NAD(P)H-hydrate dehydratase [Candidatus Izimaplasma bacterium]
MESVLSVNEIKEIEALTIKEASFSEIDLMKNAGIKLLEDILLRVKPEKDERITVVSGTGNNGGDGLVVFLELLNLGYKPKLVVIGTVESASGSFKYYFNQVSKKTKVIIASKHNEGEVNKAILSSKFVIDGIIGVGLNRKLGGQYLKVVEYINSLNKVVYSIDIPSGINPNNGLIYDQAIKANLTGIIGFYKYGNILNDALDYHGESKILDIGLVTKHDISVKLIDYHDFSIEPKKRIHNSYKYNYGLGYFFGGSKSTPGAINLSVMAALRSGQGIAYVFQENPVAKHLEVIYKEIDEDIDIDRPDSIVFGPGMAPDNKKLANIFSKINASNVKTVVDAGGLKYLDLDNINNKNFILTPHEKEFSDLFNIGVQDVEEDPFKYVKTIVEKGVTLILKGQTNVIANKKHIYLFQARNPGLATAGSGDVLTGIVSSYLKDNSPLSASIKAVLVHSIAANYARDEFGEVSMLASDIINNIYKVLK